MRITVTLDADVDAMLRAEVRRTGQTFKKVLNDSLRTGVQLLAEKRSIPFEGKIWGSYGRG